MNIYIIGFIILTAYLGIFKMYELKLMYNNSFLNEWDFYKHYTCTFYIPIIDYCHEIIIISWTTYGSILLWTDIKKSCNEPFWKENIMNIVANGVGYLYILKFIILTPKFCGVTS